MQTSILAFAARGGAGRARRTTLDGMYRLHKADFDDAELERHREALTLTPVVRGPPPKHDVRVFAYRETDDALSVPRFYGLAAFGAATETTLNDGAPLAEGLAFGAPLFADQVLAHDACVQRMRRDGGAILVRRAGGGKTVLALKIAHTLGRRCLVLVHKGFFLEQWTERIGTFLPTATVGVIRQSKVLADADFVIAMIQTVVRRDMAAVLATFGTVVIDECHHMAAPVFLSALFRPGLAPRYLLGCSATPARADGLTQLLHYGMGEPVDTNNDSGADGSAREIVHVKRVLYHGGARREVRNKAGYVLVPTMENALAADDERTALIARETVALHAMGHKTIVFSSRLAHLEDLCGRLVAGGIAQTDISFYVGSTPAKERAAAAERKVLLSTYQLAKEGLDIQTLSACVLGTPIGSVEQVVGRIQRPCASKVKPVVCVDVVDTFSVFAHMARKRERLYQQHGFDIVSVAAA